MTPEQFGSYRLISLLGKGGMAEVFLARARSIGGFEKLVAIKRLLPPFNIDNQILSMLADEARLSVWLTHPNIVQVLDFGRVGKTYYIAMEYVEGCDLCDLIRPTGQTPGKPLPLPTALYVMVQVAEALDFAHRSRNDRGERLGIIHRDVSPHNVLISTEGQVKLADFGLARASISVHHSHAGVIRGKFSYMPKEQAHGRDIDHRIDLFAAGVTLYEALTGVKPYTSTTLAQQLFQLEQPVPPPSALIPDIPEEIDDLTMQAMSPDPGDRYQSAEDLAADLRSALLKVSTFAQEEKQLTALVKSSLAARGIKPAASSLPHMSLADVPVTDDNLIGEEVLIVQQTHYPLQDDSEAPATNEIPDLAEDEEGDTSQFMQGASAPLSLPAEETFDGQRTMALSRPESSKLPATSLPPVALDPAAEADDDNLEPATEALDQLPSVAAGELDSDTRLRHRSRSGRGAPPEESFPSPAALGLVAPPQGYPASVPDADEQPLHDDSPRPEADPTFGLESGDFDQPPPYDTLRDPERAGQLAQEALDYARTIQRSPDEALVAFRRALDEREKLRRQANRVNLRPVHWAGLIALGVLLACGGGLAGWFLRGPGAAQRPPCPEPRACPTCPQAAATPLPTQTPDAAAPAPDAGQEQPRDTGVEPRGAAAGKKRPPHRRRPPRRRPRRARGESTPPAGMGLLLVTASAPGRVYVNQRTVPVPLPAKIPLPPGIHAVRVRWAQTNTDSATQWRSIKAGQTTRMRFEQEE